MNLKPITDKEVAILLPHVQAHYKRPIILRDGNIFYEEQDIFPVGYYGISDISSFYNLVYASDNTGDTDILIVTFRRWEK